VFHNLTFVLILSILVWLSINLLLIHYNYLLLASLTILQVSRNV
jgi:hypothetical protein